MPWIHGVSTGNLLSIALGWLAWLFRCRRTHRNITSHQRFVHHPRMEWCFAWSYLQSGYTNRIRPIGRRKVSKIISIGYWILLASVFFCRIVTCYHDSMDVSIEGAIQRKGPIFRLIIFFIYCSWLVYYIVHIRWSNQSWLGTHVCVSVHFLSLWYQMRLFVGFYCSVVECWAKMSNENTNIGLLMIDSNEYILIRCCFTYSQFIVAE